MPSGKEPSIPVVAWKGMYSAYPPKTIPLDGFYRLQNMHFVDPYRIVTREGTTTFITDGGASGKKVLETKLYQSKAMGSPKIIEVWSDLKVYSALMENGASRTNIATVGNINMTFPTSTVFMDKVYICDGVNAYSWDNTTWSTMTITPTSPLTIGNLVCVAQAIDRLWWADDKDYIYGSGINDPTIYDSTAGTGAWAGTVGRGDGMSIENLIPWGAYLLIIKANKSTGQRGMYLLKGNTASTFSIERIFGNPKNPVGFIGKSAVEIGADMLGLTTAGVQSMSALLNYRTADVDLVSAPINDYIRRINFSVPEAINAVYDPDLKQYMLSVPLDGATTADAVLVYDTTYDRWTTYDNWPVCSWVLFGTCPYFGNDAGQVIKTRSGNSDLGLGFTKRLVTGTNVFETPDLIKLFKSIELDVIHSSDYNLQIITTVDGLTGPSFSLPLASGASLWDVFIWDEDAWDGIGQTERTVYTLLRGKSMSIELYNDQPDQPFEVRSLTYRIIRKDRGSATSSSAA